MKKIIVTLLSLISLSSYAASVKDDCPNLMEKIKDFNYKISSKIMNGSIDSDAASTLGLAIQGLDVKTEYLPEDIERVCSDINKSFNRIESTAIKYFF